MIVVDASAIAEVLLQTPRAAAVESRIFAGGDSLHAPCLINLEIAQVLRRYALAGIISQRRGALALQNFVDMPIERHEHELLLGRIWQLRNHFSACDAAYVTLAEILRTPLVTRDSRLAPATGSRAAIELT